MRTKTLKLDPDLLTEAGHRYYPNASTRSEHGYWHETWNRLFSRLNEESVNRHEHTKEIYAIYKQLKYQAKLKELIDEDK
jgi:hypothetical protein